MALKAIIDYRDAGCVAPTPPVHKIVREIMDWIACEPVPDNYAAMFEEELDLPGEDPRRIRLTAGPKGISVIVIGCGMSGLLAGIRLKQAGIPFEIVEKNDDVGGTWYENTYPGCRVDVGNHYYCYSFEPNHGFSELYSQQPELHRYFRDLMRQHAIEEHVLWRTEVERAAWDDESMVWRVILRHADGPTEERVASAVIAAVGQLNRPAIPEIPNLDRFAGPAFHAARWDHGVDLRNKRVALIGAGASGFQIGPAIVDEVDRLVVFQRSAQWMAPNPGYHDSVHPGNQWAMRHLPGYARWYRFLLLWQATDKTLDVVRLDPEWPDLPRSANAISAQRRELLVRWIEDQIGDNAELLAKVVPNYPPMGKRMLQDNGSWLRCLRREHVTLERRPIIDVEPDAIVVDGARYEIDVIVLATGFRANDFLFPMEIVGRSGRTLAETWAGRPAAFFGISMPDFPNLFLLYGPGTNLAHAGSIIFHSECQMRYVGGCLSVLADQGGGAIEPTSEAFERYVERYHAELATLVWSHPSVEHSWYKADDGRVYVLSPWRLVDYWMMTAEPRPEDHQVRRGGE
jgi:4-hydroxyacetophenone monooxygenase